MPPTYLVAQHLSSTRISCHRNYLRIIPLFIQQSRDIAGIILVIRKISRYLLSSLQGCERDSMSVFGDAFGGSRARPDVACVSRTAAVDYVITDRAITSASAVLCGPCFSERPEQGVAGCVDVRRYPAFCFRHAQTSILLNKKLAYTSRQLNGEIRRILLLTAIVKISARRQ